MNEKEFLEAVDYIYQKSLEDAESAEVQWGKVEDSLATLMLQFKGERTVRDWRKIIDDL